MSRIKPRRLKGFRDFLPDVMARRLHIADVVRRTASLAGFEHIGTPALEYAETLLGPGGEETDKQVYRFRDHGERDVALRFDLTVPFARFVAEHQNDLVLPFKRLQIGEVWRGENTQKGRYREFGQCDLDIIGVDSAVADGEILAAFMAVLENVECGPFTMMVGHRLILSALLRKAFPGISAEGETKALIVLDKLAKVGEDQVVTLLSEIHGAHEDGARKLLGWLAPKEDGQTDLEVVASCLQEDEDALKNLERLQGTLEMLRPLTEDGPASLHLDLTIARGLGYYTGVVFETVLDELPGFGSVCSGGRYNNLAERFTSRHLPGVGGSVGLDRLLGALEEMGRLDVPGGAAKPPVYVAVATADAQSYGFGLAVNLRKAGVACHVGLASKVGQQFKHADRLGCALVLTVGTDEVASGTYAMKSLATGEEQRGLPVAGMMETVQENLRVTS